jgi:hypothetical protein
MKTLKNLFGILAILMIVLASCDSSTDEVVPDNPTSKYNDEGFFRDEWGTLIHKDAYDAGIESSEMFSSKYVWILDSVEIGSPHNRTYPRNHQIIRNFKNVLLRADFTCNSRDFDLREEYDKTRLQIHTMLIHSDREFNESYYFWKIEYKYIRIMYNGPGYTLTTYDIDLLKKGILKTSPRRIEDNYDIKWMYYHQELRTD